MPNLPGVLDKVTVVRSMAAWDAVHGRAQYYVQTGHPLNLALAKEVPAIGAVVCHELAKERKAERLAPAVHRDEHGRQPGRPDQPGLPLGRVRPAQPVASATARRTSRRRRAWRTRMTRRWQRLQQLDGSLRAAEPGLDRSFVDYHEYYRGAWAIMNDPRVAGDLHHLRRGQEALRQQRDRQLAGPRPQPLPGRRRHALHPRQPRRVGPPRRHLQGEHAQPPRPDPRARRRVLQP